MAAGLIYFGIMASWPLQQIQQPCWKTASLHQFEHLIPFINSGEENNEHYNLTKMYVVKTPEKVKAKKKNQGKQCMGSL